MSVSRSSSSSSSSFTMTIVTLLVGIIGLLFSHPALALNGATYTQSTYLTDGLSHPFIFPQAAAVFPSDGAIAVFHYGVGGVAGQAGITIISSSGIYLSSIINIAASTTGVLPPGNFSYDEATASYSPYQVPVMYIDNNNNINIVAPIETQDEFGSSVIFTGMILTRQGQYVGSFTDLSGPKPTYNGQIITIDNVNHQIHLDNVTFIDLTSYWQLAQGRIFIRSNVALDFINNRLIVLTDDSQQSYNTESLQLLIFDLFTGQLVASMDPKIEYFQNWLMAPFSPVTISSIDSSIFVTNQALTNGDNRGSVLQFKPIIVPLPMPAPGGVQDLWFTNLGTLQATAVFPSDSVIATTTVVSSNPNFLIPPYQTNAIVFTLNKKVIGNITSIRGLSNAAINAGLSASLNNYFIVAMFADSNDSLYLSTFNQQNSDVSIVLILTRQGQFIDYFGGFTLPQTPFIDRSGYLVVPDRQTNYLYVIDRNTRDFVNNVSINAPTGLCNDLINGGYIVSSGSSLIFLTAFYTDSSLSSIGTSNDEMSNPISDASGRIYVLIPTTVTQNNPTATNINSLFIYNATTRNPSPISSTNFLIEQGRAQPGAAQSQSASTMTINPNTNSLVLTTWNYNGQMIQTVPYTQ